MSIKLSSTILFMVLLTSSFASAETASVITKENAIREECKFFSPIKTKVNYNDALEVLSQAGDWFKVRFKGINGCIHKSAIEEKTFSLSETMKTKKQATTREEVALAGKGFNPQVEASYRNKHPEMKYHLVDKIERLKLSENKVSEFIHRGQLREP